MPFTLSHPAAVIGLGRTRLPMAAMVVGSMTPDIPVVVPSSPWTYRYSHSLTGMVTIDLAAALVITAVWVLLVRAAVWDMAPPLIRDRLPELVRYRPRTWLACVPAAVLGSGTHIVWDAFTHEGRWGAEHVGWLATRHAGHFGYNWAQMGSGAIGLGVVVVVPLCAVLRRPPRPTTAQVPWFARWAPPVVAGATALVSAVPALEAVGQSVRSGASGYPLHAAAYAGAATFVVALAAALTAAGIVWTVAAARTDRPSSGLEVADASGLRGNSEPAQR